MFIPSTFSSLNSSLSTYFSTLLLAMQRHIRSCLFFVSIPLSSCFPLPHETNQACLINPCGKAHQPGDHQRNPGYNQQTPTTTTIRLKTFGRHTCFYLQSLWIRRSFMYLYEDRNRRIIPGQDIAGGSFPYAQNRYERNNRGSQVQQGLPQLMNMLQLLIWLVQTELCANTQRGLLPQVASTVLIPLSRVMEAWLSTSIKLLQVQ